MIKLVMKQNKTKTEQNPKMENLFFFIFDKQRKSSHPIHSIFDSNKQNKNLKAKISLNHHHYHYYKRKHQVGENIVTIEKRFCSFDENIFLSVSYYCCKEIWLFCFVFLHWERLIDNFIPSLMMIEMESFFVDPNWSSQPWWWSKNPKDNYSYEWMNFIRNCKCGFVPFIYSDF